MKRITDLLAEATTGAQLNAEALHAIASGAPTAALLAAAAARRDLAHADRITYSPKVFIPLTRLCRDACGYCTFATTPARVTAPYLRLDEVLAIARAGSAAGCREALFTLGDKPELRWSAAREVLDQWGYGTTLDYVVACARAVLDETGLLPHINAGAMPLRDVMALRAVSASQGLMMEVLADRLALRGGPHYRCPDKKADLRLATLEAAGAARVPFTTGILVGIGETVAERIDTLLAIRASHERHGHVQEVIVQNFRAKRRTKMSHAADCDGDDHLRLIALARLTFAPGMSVQAPPNLRNDHLDALIAAGIDDWGGVSPVTIDHVNPEAAWPARDVLAARAAAAGKTLVARLATHPAFVLAADRWHDLAVQPHLLRHADSEGYARDAWLAGVGGDTTTIACPGLPRKSSRFDALLDRARDGALFNEEELITLFTARGERFAAVCAAADTMRKAIVGDPVSYVVTRNINYTNICRYRCTFCAFSKGKAADDLRGNPYDLSLAEIERRVNEAWERGATEVCLQGGIHPRYTGATYAAILDRVRSAQPALHVHAFSPLEVLQGAATLGQSVSAFLADLRRAGLGSLPGTAAEILDDDVRATLCPDKLDTAQWLEIVGTAHTAGLRTTATIMFGHIDTPRHWARHLLRLRDLQRETGGFTEFVPLPFVASEAPLYRKGRARRGPTFREAILMHAVGRLAFGRLIPNIQTSWVKMGRSGAEACLQAGANDLGGTLMDESITRAAGATHGQEMLPAALEAIAMAAGRTAWQRTTLYASAPVEQIHRARTAAPLHPAAADATNAWPSNRPVSAGRPIFALRQASDLSA